MPKYRRLSAEELEELKEDFIQFLSANGITGDHWEAIKSKEAEKVDGFLDAFSDVVFEKVMRSTLFLDHITPSHVKTFQCLGDKIVVIGLELKPEVDKDLTQVPLSGLAVGEYQLAHGEKQYTKVRELEMFEMINKGCIPSDGTYFKALSLAMAQIQSQDQSN